MGRIKDWCNEQRAADSLCPQCRHAPLKRVEGCRCTDTYCACNHLRGLSQSTAATS